MPSPQSISLKDLDKSIAQAVKIAAQRHAVKAEPGSLAIDWEIFGRRLRDLESFDAAFAFASDVSKSVKIPGFSPEPIALRVGRDILCGFIEKGRLPKLIG